MMILKVIGNGKLTEKVRTLAEDKRTSDEDLAFSYSKKPGRKEMTMKRDKKEWPMRWQKYVVCGVLEAK